MGPQVLAILGVDKSGRFCYDDFRSRGGDWRIWHPPALENCFVINQMEVEIRE